MESGRFVRSAGNSGGFSWNYVVGGNFFSHYGTAQSQRYQLYSDNSSNNNYFNSVLTHFLGIKRKQETSNCWNKLGY